MLKIENVSPVTGWEPAIRGMRNPMNSWDKSDSRFHVFFDATDCESIVSDILGREYRINDYDRLDWTTMYFDIGSNDLKLMKELATAGSEHAKYRRMLIVYLDITAPLYWWKEFDTYKVGTVSNSCSTMHKIHSKEFELDDFSHEHVITLQNILQEIGVSNPLDFLTTTMVDWDVPPKLVVKNSIPCVLIGSDEELNNPIVCSPFNTLHLTIEMLNRVRKLYLETKDKKYWWQMIQLLPSSYNQRRTIMVNYEVLANIYKQRKGHKLDEWHTFCDWIKTLPLAADIITMDETTEEKVEIFYDNTSTIIYPDRQCDDDCCGIEEGSE